MKKLLVVIALASLATTLPSSAALLVYEGFDYAAAPDGLVGQNGGTGFTSAWLFNSGQPDVAAGTMTYTDSLGQTLITSGNRSYFDSTNPDATGTGTSVVAFRDINLSGALGNTLYFSLLGEQLTGDARAINMAFFATGREAISVGHGTNTPAGGPFTWGAFTGGNGANGAYSSVSIFDSTFSVMRIDLNVNGINDRVRLYVNPPLDGEPAVADVDFNDRDVVAAFPELTRIRPFAGNSNATLTASQADWDEVRIGETYGDVTPFIPEPGSMLLASCGGLLLLARRRRA